MIPTLSGLAEPDAQGDPDPERVRIWGMDTGERAILHWRENERNQFGVFSDADSAADRFCTLFGLVPLWP